MADRKETEHTGSFTAKDEDGNEYELHIYTTFVKWGTFSGQKSEEGDQYIQTSGGGSVNRIEKGKYQLVRTGRMLTSDDPNAP